MHALMCAPKPLMMSPISIVKCRPKGVAASLRRKRTREAAVEAGVEAGSVNATSEPLAAYALNAKNRYIVTVSLGSTHSAAIDSFGRVLTYGNNEYGQLGVGDTKKRRNATYVQDVLSTRQAKQVACGENYTIVLTSDGSVYVHQVLTFAFFSRCVMTMCSCSLSLPSLSLSLARSLSLQLSTYICVSPAPSLPPNQR